MNCPKCGFEQPAGEASCAACGIVFARWQARAAASGVNAAPPPAQAPEATPAPAAGPASSAVPEGASARDARHLYGGLAAVLAGVLGLVFLQINPGLPVLEGSHEDEKHAFAVKPGDDWLTLSPENLRALAARFGGELPLALHGAIEQPGVTVSFLRLPDASEFPPSFNLVAVPKELPRLNERARKEAREALVPLLKRALDGYELELDELIRIDGVSALRFVGRARLRYRQHDGSYGAFRVRADQRVVAGRREALLFSCMEDADDFDRGIARCDPVWESLRIRHRPPRFEGALLGALRGMFAGLMVGGFPLLAKYFLG